ncbi:uncharacterized protein NEMAJ01_1604 [Nematocida major]|uniref:uncharacterized protein n=1 Tax=Nematocida major TaxID=1912982 RepID=UPI002007E42F|nr:uncharacterized protein NEMAJ01_1604 [Nematocida major]KAH9386708.1 hypothetical protein NEMAJ01_1604 [Nematocida major]
MMLKSGITKKARAYKKETVSLKRAPPCKARTSSAVWMGAWAASICMVYALGAKGSGESCSAGSATPYAAEFCESTQPGVYESARPGEAAKAPSADWQKKALPVLSCEFLDEFFAPMKVLDCTLEAVDAPIGPDLEKYLDVLVEKRKGPCRRPAKEALPEEYSEKRAKWQNNAQTNEQIGEAQTMAFLCNKIEEGCIVQAEQDAQAWSTAANSCAQEAGPSSSSACSSAKAASAVDDWFSHAAFYIETPMELQADALGGGREFQNSSSSACRANRPLSFYTHPSNLLFLKSPKREPGIKPNEIVFLRNLEQKIKSSAPESVWSVVDACLEYSGQSLRALFLFRAFHELSPALENIRGYYPGFYEDAKQYMKKTKNKELSAMHGGVCGDFYGFGISLGDIFAQSAVHTEDIEDLKLAVQASAGRSFQGYCSVLGIPEVLDDFSHVDEKTFMETLKCIRVHQKAKNKKVLIKTAVKILKYIRAQANECLAMQSCKRACIGIWHASEIETAQKNDLAFAESMYEEAYSALLLFYKYCPWQYKDSRRGVGRVANRRFLGKSAVRPQKYVSMRVSFCASAGQITPLLTACAPIDRHYVAIEDPKTHQHLHFVNNHLQAYTTVCTPVYMAGGVDACMHSIGDSILHLESLGLGKKDTIYPLIFEKGKRVWRMAKASDMQKTAQQLFETGHVVVFYNIPEKLKDNYFTLATFEGQEEHADDLSLPLFLSPFLRSALLLSPYTEKDRVPHRVVSVDSLRAGGVEPCVYTYSEACVREGFAQSTDGQKWAKSMYSGLRVGMPKCNLKCRVMCTELDILGAGRGRLLWSSKSQESMEGYSHYALKGTDSTLDAVENHNRIVERIKEIQAHYACRSEGVVGSVFCRGAQQKMGHIAKEKAAEYRLESNKDKLYLPGECYMAIRRIGRFKPELSIHNYLLWFLFRKPDESLAP